MKTSNYLYIANSQMYGMLHGMHTGGCLDSLTLEDAKEIARTEAYDVVTGYDCILEAIHEDLNDQFGYDETPEEPDEEYLDEVENAIQEEIAYVLYEVTKVGRDHVEEMLADVSDYEYYCEQGWLAPCEEEHQFSL